MTSVADASLVLPEDDQEVPEGGWAAKPHLTNSRPISWDRRAASPAAQAALDALLAELELTSERKKARRPDDQRRLRAMLEVIVLDLFVVAQDDPQRYLAYPRQREAYGGKLRRYLHPEATLTGVVQVAGFLLGQGYADGMKGSNQRKDYGFGVAMKGYRSRLRATGKLLDLLTETHRLTRADVGLSEQAEVIRLKAAPVNRGGLKPLVPYDDDAVTNARRDRLRAWQALAGRFDIRVAGAVDDDTDAEFRDEDDGAGEVVDRYAVRLYRVFNNSSWDAGGRFYGGWWLALKRDRRPLITIDGEPTVELDFKSLHPRLCYHLQGNPLPPEVDPYDLSEVLPGLDRDVTKVAFNKLVAVSQDGRIAKPPNLKLPRGVTYKAVLGAFEEKHRAIKPWLRRGRALELQHLDSQIADTVMDYFTRAMGRPVLPIHDGFRAALRDERKLGETMMLAYRAIVGDRGGVRALPKITGWSSPEMEERVLGGLRAAGL